MDQKYYQRLTVTGGASSTVADTGLDSTEEEKRTLVSVLLYVTGYADNEVEVWIERELIASIPDYLLVSDASSGSTNVQYTTDRKVEWELNHPIPVGKTAKVKIKCGGTAKNVRGCYCYTRR